MKWRFLFFAVLVLFVNPLSLFAQFDERETGVYAVVGEKTFLMNYNYFPVSFSSRHSGLFLPVTKEKVHKRYKGETSGVETSGTFVLVINRNQRVFVSPFSETMTPCQLKIVPLTVNSDRHCREIDAVDITTVLGVSFIDESSGVEFKWNRISENSFEIKMTDPKPGEYAIVFRESREVAYGYNGIVDFTIPENIKQETVSDSIAKPIFPADEYLTGLYTSINQKAVPLEYTYGGAKFGRTVFEGGELTPLRTQYKGETAGVVASDTLIYVIDPTRRRTFDHFNKWMTPNSLMIIPLTPDAETHVREYDLGYDSDNKEVMPNIDFEWEKISDNVFRIKVPNLAPGEYGVVCRNGKFGPYDFTRVHCFRR